MDILFLAFSAIALILSVTFYIFYRKNINPTLHTACAVAMIFSVLFVTCYFLNVGSLFKKEYSTVYHSVTEYSSTTEYQSGRPVGNSNETNGTTTEKSEYNGTVYITKSGTKYHYSYTCGGNEYYKCTIEQALDRGLSPCKKCVKEST